MTQSQRARRLFEIARLARSNDRAAERQREHERDAVGEVRADVELARIAATSQWYVTGGGPSPFWRGRW